MSRFTTWKTLSNFKVESKRNITPHLQFLNPGDRRISDTYVAGVRVKIDL